MERLVPTKRFDSKKGNNYGAIAFSICIIVERTYTAY
jgi:hypothetical protein